MSHPQGFHLAPGLSFVEDNRRRGVLHPGFPGDQMARQDLRRRQQVAKGQKGKRQDFRNAGVERNGGGRGVVGEDL